MTWLSLLAVAAALAPGCSRSPRSAPRGAPVASPAQPPSPSPSPSSPAPGPGAPAAPAAGRTLAAEETVRTASGATFTASPGWSLAEHTGHLELRSPEGDLRWYHVELAAADRDAALAAGWQRVAPGFALAVERTIDIPADNGWDAISQTSYVTPVEAARAVVGFARRRGATWYLELVDGSAAAYDRRGAQLITGILGMRAAGVVDESFAGKPARVDAEVATQLDAFIRRAMAAARVPGAALAIVHRGKLVFARGWGVRALGRPAPVTPKTRFMIGSVTKALTSLLMARLVDAGKLRWDTRVTELLPEFALADPEVTRALTLSHTVCACTGMPRQDLQLLFDGEATPESRVAALRSARPTTRLGETFQYSNVMVALGGYAAARAFDRSAKLGPAYARAMRELVFRPLGMTRSTFDLAEAARAEHAAPHPLGLDSQPVAQPAQLERWADPVAPAGSAWSTAEDMARVLQLELGDGTLDGVALVSRAALHARRTPQIKISNTHAYGLGLVLERDRGVDVVWHTGGTGGFSSLLWFLPEHQLGAVLLTNVSEAGAFIDAVRNRLFELWFGAPDRAETDLATALATARGERAALAARITERDPAWATALLGRWHAPTLGTIELRRERGKLVLDSGQWQVELAGGRTAGGERELIVTSVPLSGFELVPRGEGADAKLIAGSGQDSFELTRAPAR